MKRRPLWLKGQKRAFQYLHSTTKRAEVVLLHPCLRRIAVPGNLPHFMSWSEQTQLTVINSLLKTFCQKSREQNPGNLIEKLLLYQLSHPDTLICCKHYISLQTLQFWNQSEWVIKERNMGLMHEKRIGDPLLASSCGVQLPLPLSLCSLSLAFRTAFPPLHTYILGRALMTLLTNCEKLNDWKKTLNKLMYSF